MRLKEERIHMLREFFPLLLGVALQQLLALTVNLADNFMLGRFSEQAMSGAALVNQIQFVLQQLVSGCGVGISVLGAQYWGKGQTDPIRRIISLGLKFTLAMGIVFAVVTALLPGQVLGLFTRETAVISEACSYLKIMCWTYVIYSISATLMTSLRSVQTSFIGTVMSGTTIVINVCMNYCLIYGNFGCPRLGIQGAAWATLTSRCVELLIILVYLFCFDRKLQLRPKHLLQLDLHYLKDYVRVAMPMMICGALWGVAQAAQTSVLGHISAETLAANSVASVLFQLFSVFGMSAATAASVIIGKTIGSGRMDLVRPFSRTLQLTFVCLGVASGLLLIICRGPILSLYTLSEESRYLADRFILILGITAMGSCYEYPVEGGIIAGGGNTRYAAWCDTLFMWLWTIPAACVSAFVLHMPPVVTFAVLKSDQLIKCIPNGIVCNRYKYVRDLTRENEEEAG